MIVSELDTLHIRMELFCPRSLKDSLRGIPVLYKSSYKRLCWTTNALEHWPEVLCLAFSNMYTEADADWWADLKLTGIDDVIDLSPCSRQCTDSLYHLRACVVHRHSGITSKTLTSGHYIAHFSQAQKMV